MKSDMLVFILIGIIAMLVIALVKSRKKIKDEDNKFSVLSFEKKYKKLTSDMRRTDAPDGTMLCYALSYPIYRRYYDKNLAFITIMHVH